MRRRLVCSLLALLCIARPHAAADLGLVDAARHRNLAAVRALLAGGADVDAAQADGATALHWAAHWDDLAAADLLLRAGASPDLSNDLGVVPLSLACTNASAAMVRRLLEGGADPNAGALPASPLMTCARTGNPDAVKALVTRNADVNAAEPRRGQTALMGAVAGGHPDVVRVLIDAGAHVHARSTITRQFVNRGDPNDADVGVVGDVSHGGSTPLLFATRQGNPESARLLLDAGANVNDIAPNGTSALVVATHSHHTALAKLLLDRGADPNLMGAGYSALHAAVLRGNPALVRALVSHSAVVNARLQNGTATLRGSQHFFLPESLVGSTPFLLAARFLEVEIMRTLSDAGADTRLPMIDGTTPLMAAAGIPAQLPTFDRRNRLALVRIPDEPLAVAAVTLALERGGVANAANAAGQTALHGAAMQNYPLVIRLLVERGARLDVKNRRGQTPLDVANGEETLSVLRALGAVNG